MESKDSEPSSTETMLPDGVFHYDNIDEVPKDVRKYFYNRESIWLKYDEGIWMTKDGWFGVTPEPIAARIAQDVATASKDKTVLIDAFAGTGGNAIQFALSGRWNQIFAVEKDEATFKCAKHNAEVYGVQNKIVFLHGDVFEVLQKKLKFFAKKAVIFGSPPWGGPDYAAFDVFDVEAMEPYSLGHMYKEFSALATDVCLYLPRTSDVRQLVRYADPSRKLKVRQYCADLVAKAMCVYYGVFSFQ